MKVRFNSDRVFSITAFVISIATLVALVYQSNLVREQNKMIQKEQYASVMPYLVMRLEKCDDNSFGLTLSNKGLGPAFIDKVNIIYNDTIYKIPLLQFYLDVLKIENKSNIEMRYTDIRPKSMLSADDKMEIFTFSTSQEEAIQLLEPFATMDATIEIVYSSIYNQTWKMKSMKVLHIPVK